MEVVKTSFSHTFPLTSIVRARHASGSVFVPVQPSQFMYSQLKHLKGFPALGSNQGYPLAKLRSLDNLIERLKNLKGFEIPGIDNKSSVDGLIKFYQQELKRALETQVPEFLGSPSRDQGLVADFYI